jgi:eukaryotic-like serine/threonine-protein kinase
VVGTSVGPYRILEKLGAGGMGEVFLGHDPRLERRVALKCLTSAGGTSPDGYARVLREARAIARLTHPHIAGVYDVLEQEGRAFIVMEYVEGINLAAHLAGGPRPPAEVRAIGRQLASALAAAHAQGVIHRDLKPANIQVMRDGSIKVLDFGVAKLTPSMPTLADTTLDDGSMQSFGGNPGTPIYMAPEQLSGHAADARSDLYSAGVILFQMATGRRPYLDTTAVNLALAIHTDPAPPARAINPLVPLDLSDAIAKALKRNPDHRYQFASQLEEALAPTSSTAPSTRAVDPASTVGVVETTSVPGRRAWKLAAIAAAVLAAGAVATKPLLERFDWFGRAPAARPSVLAILPVNNPTGDAAAERLGAGIVAVVTGNMGSIPGVTVLPRASTAPYAKARNNLDAIRRELGADLALDLTLTSAPGRTDLMARLLRPGSPGPVWEQEISGDVFSLEGSLLDGLARALEAAGVWRRLSAADRQRLRRLPTTSAPALEAYSEARAVLDRTDASAHATDAVALLERAVSLDPNFALAYAALGDAYLELYNATRDPAHAGKANDAVMRALQISPGEAAGYYTLGNVQWVTGRYQEAIASLRRSLELQPDNDETHRMLSRVLAAGRDWDGAIAELETAIRIRPDYWRGYMQLGSVCYSAGRLPAALDAYRRASEMQPNDSAPWSGLGLIYQVSGDLSQAIGNYEHAVRLGANMTAYSNLGLVYFSAGRYAEAVEAWQKALALNPNSMLYHRNIGDAYRKLRKPELAATAYQSAVTLGEQLLTVNPRDADTIAHVAVCEAKLGRTAAAGRHISEALALAPGSRLVLQRSAEVHALLGDSAAALKDLSAAIDLGYARPLAAENDEFASLKKLPAFQALVASRPAAPATGR